jgi:hypothetical protein
MRIRLPGDWCIGNTAVSKTATRGSIPRSPACQRPRNPGLFGFLERDYGVVRGIVPIRIDPLESASIWGLLSLARAIPWWLDAVGSAPASSMEPPWGLTCGVVNQVDVGVLLLGYTEACSRIFGGREPVHQWLVRQVRATARGEQLVLGPSIRELGEAAEVDAFVPLFEALNWSTALEGRIAAEWLDRGMARHWYRAMPEGNTVKAVRFARNRVHHQWAEAITIDDSDRDLPPMAVPWIWRTTLLAGKPDKTGERLYSDQLAGEPVIVALGRLLGVFGMAVRQLADAGAIRSSLLEELLPAFESIDPREFSKDAGGAAAA